MPVMMLGLTACGDQLTPEQAEEAVLQGERDRLPLLKQEMAYFASDITIDSMHITIAEEPMQGYLYTTWISNGKQRTETPIIVVVEPRDHKPPCPESAGTSLRRISCVPSPPDEDR